MKRRGKQEWARRGPDCSAGLVDADLTVSSNPMRSFRIKSAHSRKAQALASHCAQSLTGAARKSWVPARKPRQILKVLQQEAGSYLHSWQPNSGFFKQTRAAHLHGCHSI